MLSFKAEPELASTSEPVPHPSKLAAFERDLSALRSEILAAIGPEDFAHLRKMERWGRWCSALGYATAWIAPNPLSALLMAHGNTVRWAILMHHVGHRAYERVPGLPERYRGSRFASGRRRFLDWFDWILPEAWRWEHNAIHHPRTGDSGDPDLVQRNTEWLRHSALPRWLKYVILALVACTWKPLYYAPNTFQFWRRHLRRRPGEPANDNVDDIHCADSFNPLTREGRAFLLTCLLPYPLVRFVAAPALFLVLGPWAAFSVLLNSLAAELLANVQSFLLIIPNHAGDDLVCFRERPTGRGEFSWRQVVGTVNYNTSSDFVAFLHGWTNYHIEHHLWPDLPLLKYQQYQGRLRELCAKHGLPYRQEGVLRRARKAMDIMVGASSMRGPV